MVGCLWIFSIKTSFVDVLLTVVLGLLGYVMAKRGFEPLPMVIGFLLGPQLEEFLGRALMISRGSFAPFIQRPLTTGLLFVGLVIVVMGIWLWARRPHDAPQPR